MRVAMTSIPVNNVTDAFKFYTTILGFKKEIYEPEYSLAIVVSPEEIHGTRLLLDPIRDFTNKEYQYGLFEKKTPIITLRVDDIITECDNLYKQGVHFSQKPLKKEWGIEALFNDTCGNYIQLIQKI